MTTRRGRSGGRRGRTYNLELLRSRGGNVALIFALVMPVILVTSLGAVQLNQVMTDRKRTQDVADSAALMGAGQLGVTPVGADQRTQSYALAQLADVASNATVQVTATPGQNDAMTVAIDTQRVSFFGNLLPLGGFHTHVTSTARGLNTVPLCVLVNTHGAQGPGNFQEIMDTSQLQAGQCLVYANQSLALAPGASILASAVEAVGSVTGGTVTPTAQTSAAPIPDPFSALNFEPPLLTGCNAAPPLNAAPPVALPPGTYGAISLKGGDNLILANGTYDICGPINMNGNATITGTNVLLVFHNNATISAKGAAATATAISLEGLQSGPNAGFVIATDREYTGKLALPINQIAKLTGTVYAPAGTLEVQGGGTKSSAGSNSPWTVIDANSLQVDTGAQLVINANYAVSNVPVPTGVGNQRQNVQLMQ